MKVKIEFDASINDSFVVFGESDREGAARVLRFIASKMENGEFVKFNLIQNSHHYPIGMFSVEKG